MKTQYSGLRRISLRLPAAIIMGCVVIVALSMSSSVRAGNRHLFVLEQAEQFGRMMLEAEQQTLSEECQSEPFQTISEISIHSDDPLLIEHADLLSRCNAELNAIYDANRESSGSRAVTARTIAPLEGLINFENPHVHPIDLTPDGNTLVAVNTAAHRLEVFALSGSNLTHQQSIPVGLDPVSVRARNNNEVWIVNHVSDSISIVNLNQGNVTRTLFTDNEPADVVFAGSPLRAFVSASEANAFNVFDLSNLNAAPQKIDIPGEDPRALAVSNNGLTVYAAVFESGNNTRVVGTGANAQIARGTTLADNDVAVLNANSLALSFQSGLMTMNMALAVHPTTNQITVVGTESLNDIELEPNLTGTFLRVNMARFLPGGNTTITDLNPHLTYTTSNVSQSQRNLSIGDPRGIAWHSNGGQAFITGMGSNNVVVINSIGDRVDNIEVGEGPTGIVLKEGTNFGFVMNKFSGSISVINLATRTQLDEVAFDDPTPSVIKQGRPFLYDTHRTSGLGHTSCGSCHIDGRSDRLAWDLGDPNAATVDVPQASNVTGNLTGNTVSVPGLKGPMVTQTLQDIMAHPRLHWRGDREDLAAFNPAFEGLLGDTVQLNSAEMQQFGDFLATIWLQPNPYRNIDDSRPNSVTLPDGRVVNSPSLTALRGNNQFNNNCLRCHKGGGNATRNFGVNSEVGAQVIAPSLVGLYDKMGLAFGTAGFGFFHSGEADVDRASRLSTTEQNDDFLAELLTLGGPSGPFVGDELRQVPHAGVGQQVTVNGNATSAQFNRINQFKSIASDSPFAALIAQTRINGVQRGFVYLGGNNFQSDISAEQQTEAQLLAAAANGDAVTFTLVADGMETRLALDSDLDGTFNGDEIASVSCDTRGLLFERWDGISGAEVNLLTTHPDYPLSPDNQQTVSNFEIPSDGAEEYGVRLRGYIEPTVSGNYTFWIASDDNGELWFSSNTDPASASLIARVPAWTNSREWDKYPEQQSAEVSLIGGQRYYIEALMKEWWGGDNLSVAWQRSGAARSLIGNANLCVYDLVGEAPTAVINAAPTTGNAPLGVSFNGNGSDDSDGTIVSFQWTFGNGATASGATAQAVYSLPGVYTARLMVTDNDGRVSSTTQTITVNNGGATSCTAPGLQYERWENIPGLAISDLTTISAYPDNPDVVDTLSNFEVEQDIQENYGVRVRGFIEAPVSGNYTFWIASDDNGELWLSSDENASNANLIASVPSWTAPQQWDWHPQQKSAEINLTAGQRYYVEALMKEFGGGDNLAVAWEAPGGVRQVIPAVVLCQLEADTNARPNAVLNATPTTGEAPLAVSFNGSASSDDGNIVSYVWDFGDGNSASGASQSYSYNAAGLYLATLTVTDDGGKSASDSVTIGVTSPGGVNCDVQGVTREVWNNIWNGDVASLIGDSRYPDSPTSSSNLTTFAAPSNAGDGYAARMQAYITAPETGSYLFWVASDNEGQLWLSSDTNPSNATQIARTFWSPEQGWDYSNNQQSDLINLVAGEQYFIEGLHYASWGGDYFAIAWDTPGGAREVIPQTALCAFDSGAGREVSSQSTGSSLLMQSSVAQSFPLTLYDDLLLVLIANQPLREDLLALRDETVLMLQADAVVSAEYITTLTTLYNAVYATASPDLQLWLDSIWSSANLEQYQNERAVDAWIGVNQLAVPTSIELAQSPPVPGWLVLLPLILSMILGLATIGLPGRDS